LKKAVFTYNYYLKTFKSPNKRTKEYLRKTYESTWNILEGSVRSSKSTINVLAFCLALEESPNTLHMAIASSASLARTVLFDCEGLGISYYPQWQAHTNKYGERYEQRIFKGKYQGYDALFIKPAKGNNHGVKTIIAMGGDTSVSYESFRGMSLGMVIATEINLLHLNTLNEIKARTIASKYRRVFLDFNPTTPTHYVYKWLNDLNDVNYLHMTFDDNPAITKERKEEIMKEYDPDSIEYKRMILGQRVAGEGLIYNVRDYNIITGKIDFNNYGKYVISADPGINASGTCFILCAMTNDMKEIHILHEYYHRNKDERHLGIKMPQDYLYDFFDFIKQCEQIMGYAAWRVLCDPADITFIREYQRNQYQNRIGYVLYNAVKDLIDIRIKEGINLLYTGRLKFHNICARTIDQFKRAEYDENKSKNGRYERKDDPIRDVDVGMIDATEYAIAEFRNYIYNRVTGE